MTELVTDTRVAITGGEGFLGWHLACRLRALYGIDARIVRRAEFTEPRRLARALGDADVLFHLAGVNRAPSDGLVEEGNPQLAEAVCAALGQRTVHVVYANSTQADLNNAYGRGKRRAAEVLAEHPGTLADIRLPNLFGEHGRSRYNSFVATFCSEIAAGERPHVTEDRPVPLLHAQHAAQVLIDACTGEDVVIRPMGEEHLISEVRDLLDEFHSVYGTRGEIPNLGTSFRTDLFNTYRTCLFPAMFPVHPAVHGDERGSLYETGRVHGGGGQSYFSTTLPGRTRGDHYHLRKVERFFVVRGEALIKLRRLFNDEVITFRISDKRPGFVDMPTMWVHNITNVGSEELVTSFWSDQLLDPEHPDQFREKV